MRSPWSRPTTRKHRRQGDLARANSNWPEAETHYRAHLRLDPADQPIWIQLGHSLKEQGRRDEAAACYRRALELRPGDADALFQLRSLPDAPAGRSDGRPLLLELGQLLAGEALAAGEALESRDGLFRLRFTSPGRLELTATDQAPEAPALWSTGEAFGQGVSLIVTGDGEVVVQDALGQPLWTAGVKAGAFARLEVSDAGEIVISDGRRDLWRRPEPPGGADRSGPARTAFRPSLDLDSPGALSIVVQGGLSASNAVQSARHIEHWRALFPAAEVIFAISATDLLADARPGDLETFNLALAYKDDGVLRAALEVLIRSCDAIVLSPGALPLPRIKEDSGPNNFNLQLAAAQAGLDRATGQHVLRIRSDAVFLDRRFLGSYLADCALERRDTALFSARVMVSSIFTLNPFTVERMPLHFSDWFHFGRLEDVRRLWAAPPISLADAQHYLANNHANGSNRKEELFRIRRAVEQHLVYHTFVGHVQGLTLDYHNDQTSAKLSLDVLVDNFVLCDVPRAGFVFNKYVDAQLRPESQVHCLTRQDFLLLSRRRGEDPQSILAAPIAAAARNPGRFGL